MLKKKAIQSLTLVVFVTCLYLVPVNDEPTNNQIVTIKEDVSIGESEGTIKEDVSIGESEGTETVEIQPRTVILVSNPSYETDISEPQVEEFPITDAEIELIALITMAEAEGECEEGKRLVIDTILNRVDSEYFPNTVEGVIYQKDHFSSVWNGRVNRCYVMDDICQLVKEELISRTNTDVMFFTAGHYGEYGCPMFPVGNHYFSSY